MISFELLSEITGKFVDICKVYKICAWLNLIEFDWIWLNVIEFDWIWLNAIEKCHFEDLYGYQSWIISLKINFFNIKL